MTIEMPGIIAIVLALGAGLYTAGRDIPGARRWVLGGVAGMLGVVGLFAAAGSGIGRPVSYYGGVGLFDRKLVREQIPLADLRPVAGRRIDDFIKSVLDPRRVADGAVARNGPGRRRPDDDECAVEVCTQIGRPYGR